MFKYLVLLAVCVAAASAGGIVGIGPGLPSGPWGGVLTTGPILAKGPTVLAAPVLTSHAVLAPAVVKGGLW